MLVAGFESLGYATRMKWPNDILLDDKKICGVLVEERGGRLVAGVGVNLLQPALGAVGRDSDAPAASCLPLDNNALGPLGLWLRLLSAGRDYLDRVVRHLEPELVISLMEERLAWLGETTTVVGAPLCRHGKVFDKWEGRIVGLSVDGTLRIMAEGKEQLLTSGSLLAPSKGRPAGKG
jgi:BirA family biotin operon repressor/biotin-[acetyl-CoA-carboxylase] ligase